MEEIKYGEFLRLNGGKILKYGEKTDTRVENDRYIDYSGEYEWETCIVKHSFNIIDLIEPGDYVNGHLVVDIYTDLEDFGDGCTGIEVESDLQAHKLLTKKHIKSIVTKEQFAAVEYKLDN